MNKFDQLKLKYLEDPKKALRFWMVLAFLDLVVFGFLGLQLSLSTLAEKKTKYSEIDKNTKLLQSKKFVLVDTEGSLKSVSAVLPSLYTAVPDSPDYQDYLVQLVTTGANNGFVMSNLISVDAPTNKEVSLDIQLSGNRNNVSSLVSSFERFPRLTSINTLNLDFTEPLAKMDVTLKIYFSDNQTLDLVQSPDARIDKEFLNKEFQSAHE
jgi:Tfp pilus assembly protein PilO